MERKVESEGHFISSLNLSEHPMRHANRDLKIQYYLALEFFIRQFEMDTPMRLRLRQYEEAFVCGADKGKIDGQSREKAARFLLGDAGRPRRIYRPRIRKWQKKPCFFHGWLLCDLGLLLLDKDGIQKAVDMLRPYVDKTKEDQLIRLASMLQRDEEFRLANPMAEQCRKNIVFLKKKEYRILVTANMSAGKSTLINALVGKKVARTADESCTGNVCYIYSKPFEDGHIHLETSELCMDAKREDLESFGWEKKIHIASAFRFMDQNNRRICIIDTPGINSASDSHHGELARQAMETEDYDRLVFVLDALQIGTKDEFQHLEWVSENVPKDKTVFVLNKLDKFRAGEDDIWESMAGVWKDLYELGYDHPVICPMSAYFAYLLKRKHSRGRITRREDAEYNFYYQLFLEDYDLSKYYGKGGCKSSGFLTLGERCGLYDLERIIYGG